MPLLQCPCHFLNSVYCTFHFLNNAYYRCHSNTAHVTLTFHNTDATLSQLMSLNIMYCTCHCGIHSTFLTLYIARAALSLNNAHANFLILHMPYCTVHMLSYFPSYSLQCMSSLYALPNKVMLSYVVERWIFVLLLGVNMGCKCVCIVMLLEEVRIFHCTFWGHGNEKFWAHRLQNKLRNEKKYLKCFCWLIVDCFVDCWLD